MKNQKTTFEVNKTAYIIENGDVGYGYELHNVKYGDFWEEIKTTD